MRSATSWGRSPDFTTCHFGHFQVTADRVLNPRYVLVDYAAFRYKKWKISFLTQERNGFDVWDAPYVPHRAPRIVDLRADPFEFAQQPNASWNYQEWMFRRIYLLVPAQGFVGAFVKSSKEFPPRSAPASFSVGDALKMISTPQHN